MITLLLAFESYTSQFGNEKTNFSVQVKGGLTVLKLVLLILRCKLKNLASEATFKCRISEAVTTTTSTYYVHFDVH